jgi:hypothetical protein
MRWAALCARNKVRRVSLADLPVVNAHTSKRFAEILAEFRAQLLPGDELYHYDSHQEEWERLMGSEGYVIVRDGELIDTLVMKMN